MSATLTELDQRVLDQYVPAAELPLVFILGSPRTGSTLIYQLLINAFGPFYISNFINDAFAEHPAVGAVLDQQLNPREPVPYESHYGKTASCFGPSEGSLVFRHWFGGEHPSQTKSAIVLPPKREHMLRSLTAIHAITGRAIVLKNAWNCFRVRELSRLFPKSAFIWVRRDIEAAAVSDLESRYAHGSPERWNSATVANYLEIQRRPYWEQVVEQQYEYHRAMSEDLRACCPDRAIELWYEDVCVEPAAALDECGAFFARIGIHAPQRPIELPRLSAARDPKLSEEDRARIHDYVRRHAVERLHPFIHATAPRNPSAPEPASSLPRS